MAAGGAPGPQQLAHEKTLGMRLAECVVCEGVADAAEGAACPHHPLCEICHLACRTAHATSVARATGGPDTSSRQSDHPCPCPGWAHGRPCTAVLGPPGAPPSKLGRLMKATPAEEEAVVRQFMESAGLFAKTLKVEKVYRVANRALTHMYAQCRERFRKTGDDTERVVYHGTSRQASGSIIKNGFDLTRAGKANGQACGHGIYAGATAQVSHSYTRIDAADSRRMFICLAAGGPAHTRRAPGGILVFPREQQVLPCWVIDYN